MKQLWLLLLPFALFAVPAQVILMRNAESSLDSSALSLRGRERSMALDPFFQGTPSVLFYGLPAAIFAGDKSSQETVAYLANAIHVPVSDEFFDAKTLARELLQNPDYEGKMVLVCSPQEQIPSLASLLGAKKAPKKWKEDAFDRLWILTFDDKEKVAFNDVAQKLLYGDSGK